jgi:hypothetical protein
LSVTECLQRSTLAHEDRDSIQGRFGVDTLAALEVVATPDLGPAAAGGSSTERDLAPNSSTGATRRSGPNMCWSRTFHASGSSGKSKNIGRSGGAPVALKSAIRRIT